MSDFNYCELLRNKLVECGFVCKVSGLSCDWFDVGSTSSVSVSGNWVNVYCFDSSLVTMGHVRFNVCDPELIGKVCEFLKLGGE